MTVNQFVRIIAGFLVTAAALNVDTADVSLL
jgi:hypothetical protein